MQKKSGSINLLSTTQKSFFEQFINWALTIGRIVVIVTELIALGAFLYRFSLDQQLIDLHSRIKQEQAIVSYLKDSEATYRNLQDRLAVASKFGNYGASRVKIFDDIIGFAPSGIIFNDFSLNDNQVRINAEVLSIDALSSFVNSVKKYYLADQVIIEKIQNRPSNGIIAVTITMVLKGNK